LLNGEVHLARYVTIAADIADRIVRGEYREGQKIFGRSTLAGKYNVSPETIRRALTLLQEVGIVQVEPGVGVVVQSMEAAQKYMTDFDQRRLLHDIHEKLFSLTKERDRLNDEIAKLMQELLEHTLQLETRLYKIEQWKVSDDSPLIGQSLVESIFNENRVLAIQRKDQGEITDPSPDSIIKSGDIIIYYGPLHVRGDEGLIRI